MTCVCVLVARLSKPLSFPRIPLVALHYDKVKKIQRAGQLRRQGLALNIIASRLGVSTGEASKLAKQAALNAEHQLDPCVTG